MQKVLRDDFGNAIGHQEELGKFQYLELKEVPEYNNFDSVKIIYDASIDETHQLRSDVHLDDIIEDVKDHELSVRKEIHDDSDFNKLFVTYVFTDEDGNYFSVRTSEARAEDVEYTEVEIVE